MDLEKFTLAELRELAKNKGIKNCTKYKNNIFLQKKSCVIK